MLRFNRVLHSAPSAPPVLALYEVMLYRGLCFFYLDQPNRALLDYGTALEIYQEAIQQDTELTQRQKQIEQEIRFNSCLVYIIIKEFGTAHSLISTFLKKDIGYAPVTWAAIHFLKGVCELALDDLDEARGSFMQSYSHDAIWVDDFLYRQSHDAARSFGRSLKGVGVSYGQGTAIPGQRIPTRRNVLFSLFPEPQALSARLPPKTVLVQDVTLYVRPSCDWPEVRPVDLTPKVNLSLLRFAQHHEIATTPEIPW